MSFLPLKNLLPRSVRAAGIASQVQAAQVLTACQTVLAEVLKARVARHVRPLSVRHNQLTLEVPSPSVAQELRLRQREILRRLNQRGLIQVEGLRFRIAAE